MKAAPIFFDPHDIRAILREHRHPYSGKSRALTCFLDLWIFCSNVPKGFAIEYFTEEEPGHFLVISDKEGGEFPPSFDPWITCPWGRAGSRLWIQEDYFPTSSGTIYQADAPDILPPYKWHHGFTMPRKYSRIMLEILKTSIQRPQDLTCREAQREGVECVGYDAETSATMWKNYMDDTHPFSSPRDSFLSLWTKRYGKTAVALNQWNWTIEFKIIEIKEN